MITVIFLQLNCLINWVIDTGRKEEEGSSRKKFLNLWRLVRTFAPEEKESWDRERDYWVYPWRQILLVVYSSNGWFLPQEWLLLSNHILVMLHKLYYFAKIVQRKHLKMQYDHTVRKRLHSKVHGWVSYVCTHLVCDLICKKGPLLIKPFVLICEKSTVQISQKNSFVYIQLLYMHNYSMYAKLFFVFF